MVTVSTRSKKTAFLQSTCIFKKNSLFHHWHPLFSSLSVSVFVYLQPHLSCFEKQPTPPPAFLVQPANLDHSSQSVSLLAYSLNEECVTVSVCPFWCKSVCVCPICNTSEFLKYTDNQILCSFSIGLLITSHQNTNKPPTEKTSHSTCWTWLQGFLPIARLGTVGALTANVPVHFRGVGWGWGQESVQARPNSENYSIFSGFLLCSRGITMLKEEGTFPKLLPDSLSSHQKYNTCPLVCPSTNSRGHTNEYHRWKTVHCFHLSLMCLFCVQSVWHLPKALWSKFFSENTNISVFEGRMEKTSKSMLTWVSSVSLDPQPGRYREVELWLKPHRTVSS